MRLRNQDANLIEQNPTGSSGLPIILKSNQDCGYAWAELCFHFWTAFPLLSGNVFFFLTPLLPLRVLVLDTIVSKLVCLQQASSPDLWSLLPLPEDKI